jgi:hypothetical protein
MLMLRLQSILLLLLKIVPGACVLGLRGTHTANCRGCSKRKQEEAAVAKRDQKNRGRKDGVSMRPPALKSTPFKPSTELDPGCNQGIRGGRAVEASSRPKLPPLHPVQKDGTSAKRRKSFATVLLER